MQILSGKRITTKRVEVSGIVQGVGFRPFIYRLAKQNKLRGTVRNLGGLVEIFVTGFDYDIEQFLIEIEKQNPPAAIVKNIHVEPSALTSFDSFTIEESGSSFSTNLEVSPDLATCNECISEFMDSSNRRFNYPFTNCTNCGPRYTIITAMPYDRSLTTMNKFQMCRLCLDEYENVMDRRFHAQPNACFNCGPQISFKTLIEPNLDYGERHALEKALYELSKGRIIAIKGLGGFHLACDATNSDALSALRVSKRRDAKPFAVMMANLEMVKNYCVVTDTEEDILTGSIKPIVLLESKGMKKLPDLVSCGIDTLGVMLPYTPLHYLLLGSFGKPLVMTSGNLTDEPICITNKEAYDKLENIADGFLVHNRDIENRYDDSVVKVSLGFPRMIRRARGYAPSLIPIPFRAKKPVLALGGQLKNTVCFIYQDKALVSQHIGDLDCLEAQENFESIISAYADFFDIEPAVIAYDMHPDYASNSILSRWFKGIGPIELSGSFEIVSVQHHHAHIVSCMVENNLNEKVIGVAFDGIGYGSDETLWGGEFLICDYKNHKRVSCLEPVHLLGGQKAITQPWRMALSYLLKDDSDRNFKSRRYIERLKNKLGNRQVEAVLSLKSGKESFPKTSSMGRLFDAVSSILGLCDISAYEGHAAMLLEAKAGQASSKGIGLRPYAFETDSDAIVSSIKIDKILNSIFEDLDSGLLDCEIAYKFHLTVSELVKETCLSIRARSGLNKVCLSGGVFQNKLLSRLVHEALSKENFSVYLQLQVPANDGGLSLGQAAIGLSKSGNLELSKKGAN